MRRSFENEVASGFPLPCAREMVYGPGLEDRKMNYLAEAFVELLRRAATDLPKDVQQRLVEARAAEKPESNAANALDLMLRNVADARAASAPLCQDTGTHTWYVYAPLKTNVDEIRRAIHRATVVATRRAYLRPNTMHSLTGENPGDNLGIGHPVIHFRLRNRPGIRADLLLKGGGCENCSSQYSLPDIRLGAGRDPLGVRAVALHAVHRAQGRGCAPGVLGVAIGGDRAAGFATAKEQLLRHMTDVNPDHVLRSLENDVTAMANRLGIGPMGFGGRTTLLATKMAKLHRLPATYFVTVAYMCWACRRASVVIAGRRKIRFSQMSETAKKYLKRQ